MTLLRVSGKFCFSLYDRMSLRARHKAGWLATAGSGLQLFS